MFIILITIKYFKCNSNKSYDFYYIIQSNTLKWGDRVIEFKKNGWNFLYGDAPTQIRIITMSKE